MTITPFGWLFLVVLVLVLACRPFWLAGLVVVASVLHAPVVLTLPGVAGTAARIGVTPWMLACAATVAVLAASMLRPERRRALGAACRQRLFLAWCVFFAWTICSAFVLPRVFEGIPTYNVASSESIAIGTEPLAWRPVYAVHALNFLLIWTLFAGVQLHAGEPRLRSALVGGFAVAAGASVVVSLAQRALVMAGQGLPRLVEESLNPAYVQTPFQQYGSVLRVGLPFSEPSYASAWFAALFTAGLGAFLFTGRWRLGLALLVGGLLGLANSLGGSGLAGAFLAAIAITSFALIRWLRAGGREAILGRRLAVLGAALAVAAGIGTVLVARDACAPWCPAAFYEEIVTPRLANYSDDGRSRYSSNVNAVRVLAATGGLGVGAGANRASSHLLSMASTLGVLATTLFYVLLVVQARHARARGVPATLRVLCGCGLAGMLASVVAGIPDANWPALWVWVLASFALAATPARDLPASAPAPTA